MTPAQFKAIRNKLGLSQVQLGKKIYLTDRTIRRIENDGADISERVEDAMNKLVKDV